MMNDGRAPDLRFRHYPWLVKLLAVCIVIQLSLVICDLTINWLDWSESGAIRRLFNITREDGLASLFAVIQTLAVAVTTWLIALLVSGTHSSRFLRVGWVFLAVFFTVMAIDDGAKVHERLGTVYKENNTEVYFFSYGWQKIIAPVYALCGVLMAAFLWCLGRDSIRRPFIVAALGLLASAMLIDFWEGVSNGYVYLLGIDPKDVDTVTHFSKSLEEFLEMLAMSLLLVAFLEYLLRLTWSVEIRISKGRISLTDRRT